MSPEERKLLDEVSELTRENHKMLRQLVGSMRWARFWLFFRWAIIIVSIFGTYYYLQPLLDKTWRLYDNLTPGDKASSTPDWGGLLQKISL